MLVEFLDKIMGTQRAVSCEVPTKNENKIKIETNDLRKNGKKGYNFMTDIEYKWIKELSKSQIQ